MGGPPYPYVRLIIFLVFSGWMILLIKILNIIVTSRVALVMAPNKNFSYELLSKKTLGPCLGHPRVPKLFVRFERTASLL